MLHNIYLEHNWTRSFNYTIAERSPFLQLLNLIRVGLDSPQDLGLPDQLGELLDLCLGRHVHILITNAHDHAPENRGIRLWEGGREIDNEHLYYNKYKKSL